MCNPLLSLSLLAAATLPAAPGHPIAAATDWTALPLPELCIAPGPALGPAPLWSGSHIVLDPRVDSPTVQIRRPYRMPVANVLELIEGDALRRGKTLRFHRPAPPLIANGSTDALEGARVVLDALDAAGGVLKIELAAHLFPGFDGSGRTVLAPTAPAEFRSFPGGSSWHATAFSGDDVFFGSRSTAPFLAGFDVQVAAGSGAPDPVFGTVVSGRTLHLRAWRVDGGRSIFVSGLLDLSEAEERVDFDPGDPELGRLEQPAVRLAQIAFSGVVPSGGALRVSGRGAPGPEDAWTLVVEARTETDSVAGWRCMDLALVETNIEEPPIPHPGSGVATGAVFGPVPVNIEPLTASSLWGEVEMTLARASRTGERAARPLLAYTPGLLAGPAENGALWDEAAALLHAAEASRTQSATLRVVSGRTELVLPVASGAPTRVLVGRERVAVTDYRVEIATETWLAAPVVEKLLDGVLVQGRLQGNRFPCVWWTAASSERAPLGRGSTAHGRVQRIERAYRAGASTTAVGAQPIPAAAAEAGHPPAPTLELRRP